QRSHALRHRARDRRAVPRRGSPRAALTAPHPFHRRTAWSSVPPSLGDIMRSQPDLRLNFLCAALLAALAAPAAAQDAASAATTLDKVNVTGSRIKRVDVEAALPVTIVQKAEIEAQGITSAEQLLSFLNIAGNGADGMVSASVDMDLGELRGTAGVSGANLRGQGSDATLVLLNGRRVATHGLRGQAVDLNSIPFAAIDRVEVLRDGASAMYGTDAIGGVINFIT